MKAPCPLQLTPSATPTHAIKMFCAPKANTMKTHTHTHTDTSKTNQTSKKCELKKRNNKKKTNKINKKQQKTKRNINVTPKF